MALSPIALFVYNRLQHTQNLIASLLTNQLAKESALFIYSDAPRSEEDAESVLLLRKYLKGITGFRQVNIIEGKDNLGPARSIITGVTRTVDDLGKVIVLEDDLVVSRYFLKFMNDALDLYQHQEKVMSIGGYMYPVEAGSQETLFLRIPDTWGWATWKRGWDLFEPDGAKLLRELSSRGLLRDFDLDGAMGYKKMLTQQISGERDSWGIRWVASAILANRLSLYPAKSLVRNSGFDASGRHCGFLNGYDTEVFQGPVKVAAIPLEEDKKAIEAIKSFHKKRKFKFLMDILLCRR